MIDHVIPPYRSWEVCFYCGGRLPAKHKEHIFNSSWTGKHKTGSLICDTCNASFASEVDKAFFPYTKYIMNVRALKGERHKEAPTIKTKKEIVIRLGGKPESPPLINLRVEDGKLYFQASAPDKPTLRRFMKEQLPDIESNMGRSLRDDEHELLRNWVRKAEFSSEPAGSVELKDSIDPQLQVRSTLHTILKCMALYDPNFTKHISQDILNFSRYGTGEWSSYAVHAFPRFVDIVDAFSSSFTDFNAVEVHYVPAVKLIAARLVILGRLNRWVVISNQYEGPYQILFVAEPSLSGMLDPLLMTFPDTFPANVEVKHAMEPDDFVEELVQVSRMAMGPMLYWLSSPVALVNLRSNIPMLRLPT
ncbi:HNH endonuclease [Cohnella phaseoli]|uniref:HNH endonuclease n=1 Tax=Cohnella phaseoli TaxID=456490 RepID=A0A3D9JRB9_9BACL|nr:HNH endonuclease [Cohnella phaseoli]RED76097.1 HNH endonuclease [Cohnella phaseoli]